MASPTLVIDDIEKGRSLVALLDQLDIQVDGAFWFYYTDSERWRLTVVTPLARQGTRDLYARCINAGAEIDMSIVEFVPPENAIYKALKGQIRLAGTNAVRISHSSFNGVYVDDALFYRLAA